MKFRKLENPMETININGVEIKPDEVFEVTDGFETTEEDEKAFDTMIDLDRDMPGFEGTMDALEDLVDGVVGEPEFLGGR